MLTDPPPARTRKSQPQRLARRGVAFLALLAGLFGLVIAPSPASAAPPYATEASIDAVQFTEGVVQSGTKAELTGSWSLPDNPATPAGFVVDLPGGLRGLQDAFPLLDAGGALMGSCVTTADQLVCDLDSEYVKSHPVGLSGGFSFWATVTTEVTEQTTVEYDFGDASATVEVTPAALACTDDCDFVGRSNFKSGEYQNGTDTIFWDVAVGAGATGMTGGQEVVVHDILGPNQALLPVSASGERFPSLWATNTLMTLPGGLVVPGPFVERPLSDYVVSADGATVSFTAEEGYFYNVHYLSEVTDGGAAGTYRNAADIKVGTQTTATTTSEVTRHGGSGTGGGTQVGTFTIAKHLRGDDANLDDLTFRGAYSVAIPGSTPVTGDFAVQAGETWTSPAFPVGSIVELSESLAGLPGNLDWAAPDFSSKTFAIEAGNAVDVSLNNTATLRRQPFSAVKTVSGPSAATTRVPADTVYVIEYSYPAGPGFAAGSGELTLTAGESVSAPALPVGADVTIRERAPKPIEGISWGAPQISPERFTVGDQNVTVAVKNPVDVVVPPPVTPKDPGVSGSTLASTGTEGAVSSLLLAALLLGGGASLVVRRRLRRSHD